MLRPLCADTLRHQFGWHQDACGGKLWYFDGAALTRIEFSSVLMFVHSCTCVCPHCKHVHTISSLERLCLTTRVSCSPALNTTTLWKSCPRTSSAPPSRKATVNLWVPSSARFFVGMTVTLNVGEKTSCFFLSLFSEYDSDYSKWLLQNLWVQWFKLSIEVFDYFSCVAVLNSSVLEFLFVQL